MLRKRAPVEWKPFVQSLPFQPAPVFVLLGILADPIARMAPGLLRASCEGRARATLEAVVLVAYIALGMPLSCAAYYLGYARRRIAPGRPRAVADLSLILVLLVGVATLAVLGRSLAARWPVLRPALSPLRDACWK